MKRFISFLIVAGIIGVVGPFFGLGLRGMETASNSMGIGAIFLIVGIALHVIRKGVMKKGEN